MVHRSAERVAIVLTPPGAEDRAEPVEVMAEAALALCSGDPRTLTGRIAYSQALLDELRVLG